MIEAPIVEAIKRDNWIKRRDYSLINDCDQYFQSHPGELTRIVTPKYSEVGAAFRGHGKVILTCVDEGIRDDIDLSSLGVEGPFRLLHIAGSGITQPEIVERNCFAYSSIYGVTAHEDCGAAAVIAAQTGEDQTKIAEDFAKLRNLAQEQVAHDWVLHLDADEEISLPLQEEIKQVIKNAEHAGYCLKRKDYFLGRWLQHGETGDLQLLKLGRKHRGKWIRSVHETWNIEGNIGQLNNPLLHYPHPTVAEFLERINRWTTLNTKVFCEQGVTVSWWQILLYPSGKFFLNYLIKLGFLDEMPGFIMALMMSFHSFLTRAKLYMFTQERSDAIPKPQ